MSSGGPSEQSFLKHVARHEMITLRDDGIYRHIRFKEPGTSNMYFDLVTWPGYLAYSGDMGCFVFSRLDDMFEFFRADRQYQNGSGLKINLSYWAEKLQAVDGGRSFVKGVTEFDEDLFSRIVLEHLVGWIREHRDETTKDERRELWDDVIDNVINADDNNDGSRKQIAAHDFDRWINDEVGSFEFRDFWEHNITRYTFHFVWCCYALAWGISLYDDAKLKQAA